MTWLAIVGTLLSFGIWLYRRNAAAEADPLERRADRIDEYEREVLENDERGANLSLDDDLERLRARAPLQGDRRGPDRLPDHGGTDEDFRS